MGPSDRPLRSHRAPSLIFLGFAQTLNSIHEFLVPQFKRIEVLGPEWVTKGWRVKIRNRERLEPPHVTILRKTIAWRLDLRTWQLLDVRPDPSEVPKALLEELRTRKDELCRAWNKLYPG